MTVSNPPIKNQAWRIYIALQDNANPGSYLANPTMAAGKAKVSIDGGTLNNLGTTPSVVPAASIWVQVDLSATEMNGDNIAVQFIDTAAPKLFADYAFVIQTTPAALPANAIQWVGGTIPAPAVTGVPKADATYILGTLLSEGAGGRLAAAFKKFFDVATSTLTTAGIDQTGDSFARIGVAGAGLTALGDTRIANLDAAVSTRTKPADTQAAVTTVANLTTNNDKTGYALTAAEENAIADALLDRANAIETAWTLRQTIRVMAAALFGKSSGAELGSPVYRSITDVKARITATIDANKNRTAVTPDGT